MRSFEKLKVVGITAITLLAFCEPVSAGPAQDAAGAEQVRSYVSEADARRASLSAEINSATTAATRQLKDLRQSVMPSLRMALARTASGLYANGPAFKMGIPVNQNGSVQLGRANVTDNGLFSVSLPGGSTARTLAAIAPQLTGDGSAVYSKLQPGTDVVVQAYADSVRIATVLSGNEAPVEFAYKVNVPAGGKIEKLEDGGILVVDAQEAAVGGFAAPWAVDSSGKPVPTSYEIRGDTVVQLVAHRDATFKYPVVADPWLFIDLISSASWRWNNPYGWTLQVKPTGWARANAGGYLVGVAGWNELYSKYKNHGLNTNLGSMKNQFICHQQVVAVVEPTKPTWNIDEWRPNVGYAATVNARCNPGEPGGGKIID